MKRSSRAWILLPVLVIAMAVAGWVISSYQEEAGIIDAGKGSPAAVSAVLTARAYALGEKASGYETFTEALLVAEIKRRDLPVFNPVDTRISRLLTQALDCLHAAREAWQADLDAQWDPSVQGAPVYWQALHPSLAVPDDATLTPLELRRLAVERASSILDQAIALVT